MLCLVLMCFVGWVVIGEWRFWFCGLWVLCFFGFCDCVFVVFSGGYFVLSFVGFCWCLGAVVVGMLGCWCSA